MVKQYKTFFKFCTECDSRFQPKTRYTKLCPDCRKIAAKKACDSRRPRADMITPLKTFLNLRNETKEEVIKIENRLKSVKEEIKQINLLLKNLKQIQNEKL